MPRFFFYCTPKTEGHPHSDLLGTPPFGVSKVSSRLRNHPYPPPSLVRCFANGFVVTDPLFGHRDFQEVYKGWCTSVKIVPLNLPLLTPISSPAPHQVRYPTQWEVGLGNSSWQLEVPYPPTQET
eukprot:767422-Hanusia_phi.AAC.3